MALLQPGRGDPDELAVLQLARSCARRSSPSPRAGRRSAGGHRRERAAVGHLALDALGHQLVLAQHVVLEVAVLGEGAAAPRDAASRRASPCRGRSLNCLPLMKMSSPGLSSQPASRLPSMTVSAPAAIALAMSPEYCTPPSPITGTPAGRQAWARLVDRGDLRDADAGDDPGGADRAGPDADLDAVGAGVDRAPGRPARWRRCRR